MTKKFKRLLNKKFIKCTQDLMILSRTNKRISKKNL